MIRALLLGSVAAVALSGSAMADTPDAPRAFLRASDLDRPAPDITRSSMPVRNPSGPVYAGHRHGGFGGGSAACPFTGQLTACQNAPPNGDFINRNLTNAAAIVAPGQYGYAIMDGQNTTFNAYNGPDNIAGYNYKVGFDPALIIFDPTTFNWTGQPCNMSTVSPVGGLQLTCSNNANVPILISGFKFGATAAHDCVLLSFAGFNDAGAHTVTNNDFTDDVHSPTSQCANTTVAGGWTWITDASASTSLDIERNDLDGDWYGLGGFGHAFNVNNATSNVTVKYNKLSNFGGRFGGTKGGASWDTEDNYYQDEVLGAPEHGEVWDFGGLANVGITAYKFIGNTVIQTNQFEFYLSQFAGAAGSTITGCPGACQLTVGTVTFNGSASALLTGWEVVGAGLTYNCNLKTNLSGGTGTGGVWSLNTASSGYGSGCANAGPEEMDIGVTVDITATNWLTDDNPLLTLTGDSEVAHNTFIYNASKSKFGTFYPVGGAVAFAMGAPGSWNIQGNHKYHDNRMDATGMLFCQESLSAAGNASVGGTGGQTVTVNATGGAFTPWTPGMLLTNTNAGLGFTPERLLAYGATDPNTGSPSTCALSGTTLAAVPCTMVLAGGNQTVASNTTWLLYTGFNSLTEANNVNLKDGSAATTGYDGVTNFSMNSGAGYHCNGALSVP
jgi:hypothetical protein